MVQAGAPRASGPASVYSLRLSPEELGDLYRLAEQAGHGALGFGGLPDRRAHHGERRDERAAAHDPREVREGVARALRRTAS